MSKFIRLTLRDQEIFLNAEQIEYIKPFADGSIRALVESRCELHRVTETPDQILSLIEGDESGLRERVEFLERDLAQAEVRTGMYVENGIMRTDTGGWWDGSETPQLCAYVNNEYKELQP